MNIFHSMKIKTILAGISILASSAIFSSFTDHTENKDLSFCNATNTVFQNGEELIYKIYYNWNFVWIPAGEVVFTIQENKDSYEMVAIGKTYKSYNSIFKVNDYYYSKTDKITLLPKNFVRIIEEGKYRIYDSIVFDQQNFRAISYHGKDKASAQFKSFQLGECMHDLISNIYTMRNLPTRQFKKGDIIPIKVFFDKEKYPLNIRFAGTEEKDIKDLGKWRTIKLHPQLVEGNIFKRGDQMSVWVSDDLNKIPLLIESPVAVGSIKAVLKSSRGLRYETNSKIGQ
jgi:hypothetical protein